MSKMSKAAGVAVEANKYQLDKVVTNFMGGDSYTVNPLDTLKMVSASSIFGEASYYRDSKISGESGASRLAKAYRGEYLGEYDIMGFGRSDTTEDIMTKAIDNALDYNFEETLKWAVELRNQYFIRLNPQVILVRAAIHPKRKEFTEANPAMFAQYAYQIMARPDDVMSGISYYLYNSGSKAKMPSVLKRAYANKLSSLNRYQVAKYKNHDIGMIDAVRITHARSNILDELMKNGTIEVEKDEMTWENLRSAGKSWAEVFMTVDMGHMALLRNLRGFFSEVDDIQLRMSYLSKLKAGVLKGKQLPFRYYNAYNAVSKAKADIKDYQMVLDTLEECLDISIDNMPKLKGRTVVLSDNSGSAWGTIPTEYGSVTIAEINNLSAVITAANSDVGMVIKFGDTIREFPISKRTGILRQAIKISENHDDDVGGCTEGGIWEFFRDSTANREHWDNIFIYSDQQAGHGGLYGTSSHYREYADKGYSVSGHMINVFKLVLDYRKHVNHKVNVFSVQTAGYDNNVLPEYAYRTNLMYGWTGRESIFADVMIKQWDAIESRNKR